MSGRYLKRYDGLSSVKAIRKNVKGVFKDSKKADTFVSIRPLYP
jgi:hypothetical protein